MASNPTLGLSLGFAEGVAMVSLRDRRLAEGLTVQALDLELLDVELPLDVTGGAKDFQRNSTRLRHVEIAIDLAALSERIGAVLAAKESPLAWVRLVPDAGGLMLEGELVTGGRRAPVAASLVLGPAEPRAARLFVVDAFSFDWVAYPAIMLPDLLEAAIRGLFAGLGERAGQSVRRVGRTSFAFDPVEVLLWSLLPPYGWKMPAHEHVAVRSIEARADGTLVFAAGQPVTKRPSIADPESLDDAALFAMAREEAGRIAPDASAQLAEGDLPAAFREIKAALDAGGGPDVVVERVLSIGIADPDLAVETSDLADDELARNPEAVPALLAKGALASKDGFSEQAAIVYEQAARALRKRGRRRLAGMAFMAAARHRKDLAQERVRLLEEAIAVRADDPDALEGLIEELPRVGRASAAVRAARRLANIGRDAKRRALGHIVAGELLRDPLRDPAQAKREFERALRLVPDDGRALEGLARAVIDQGDPRRAASILETLIDRAEREADRPRASRLCLVLGRFWRVRDREAAMTRFRKAHELDPEALAPLYELAQVAVDGGRIEAAIEAVERAIALLERKKSVHADEAFAIRKLAGELYEGQLGREEALAQYEAAKAIDPSSPEVLTALARLYEMFGQDDRRAEVLLERGRLAAEAGELDDAAELWAQRALLGKDDRASLEKLATYVEDALEQDRSHRRLLDLRVTVTELIGAPKPIVDAIDRRLLLEDPPVERAGILARLGEALERSGRQLEATRAYEEAVGLDPRSARAITALTRIYRTREDRARLADVLARAAELTPDARARGEIFLERARLLAELGRDADAHAAATAALDVAPQDLERLALATALAIKLERFERALELAHRRLALVKDGTGGTGDSVKLDLYVDLAKIAEALGDENELASALELAHELAAPDSELGRQLAARLAKALHAAGRHPELAGLMRRRARIATTPASERAERFVEAARISARLNDDVQAQHDVDDAIEVLTFEGGDPAVMESAFDVLESIAKKRNDPLLLSDVVGRRAGAAADPAVRERLRLEQARVLDSAKRWAEAVACLEEAAEEFPTSAVIAVRLGEAAERAQEGSKAAAAYGRAARLASDADKKEESIDLHVRAARLYAQIGERPRAIDHDRALLALVPPGEQAIWMEASIERLELHAREQGDHPLLVEVLGRRAVVSPPMMSAKLLLEKATVEATALDDERAALDSLRRGRSLAPEGSEIADLLDEELIGRLEQGGQFSELAGVLVESAERSTDPSRQSGYYLRAARIYDEKLGTRQLALSRAQAAVRADHTNEAARQLRIALLRDIGKPQALVDALAEEAALSQTGGEAASLWAEAAELLAPRASVEAGYPVPRQDVERALQFVRRAATASPRSSSALFAAAAYTRALGHPEEELVALGQLVEREIFQSERAAAHLRRAELSSTEVDDPARAQAELSSAIEILERLHASAPLLEYLPPSTRTRIAAHPTPLTAALHWGLELTERTSDWATQVRMLMSLVDLSDNPEVRANMRTHAGEVLEWRIGDGAAAEREYLAALAILPDYGPARKALRSFYVAVDRFGDLAENLGIDALREVWAEVRETGPEKRMIEAAEALWPRLEEAGAERAEVQLALADLYTDVDGRAADVVHVLEQVVKTAPRNFQKAALDRLRVLFLEEGRFDLYCDVLRRQAERMEDDRSRALATVELAEALEWKLGDGHAAEQEYLAAIAIDRECEPARTKLAELLSSQNRFEDVGSNLGAWMLRTVLDQLLSQGERDRERALAAAGALEPMLPALERAPLWLHVADRFAASGGEDQPRLQAVRSALLRAVEIPGPDLVRGLDLLRPVLRDLEDWEALADALRRRIELEEDASAQSVHQLELVRLLVRSPVSPGEHKKKKMLEEAELILGRILERAPEHEEARELLRTIYLEQRRLLEIGRRLGVPVLRTIRVEAEEAGDRPLVKGALAALAELAEGTERAALLVESVGFDEDNAERLYGEALASDPDSTEASEGLRALLERQGRFREIADRLSPDSLRRTVEALRRLDERSGLLPAALALASVLEGASERVEERAALLVEVATLQQLEEDVDAAEHSLREALRSVPDHGIAREELRALLVAQRRLTELADVDESLVAITAQRAADANDVALEIAALSVLASRRESDARADTLVLVAALEQKRGAQADAEAALHWALEAAPDHTLARSELENALWSDGRFAELVASLGPGTLVHRAHAEIERDPMRVYRALDSLRERLPDELAAEAFELTALIERDGVAADLEWRRRMDHLEAARGLWDSLERPEGQERVRIAIAELWRERGGSLERLLSALQDAFAHARGPETRGELAVEQATLLTLAERSEEAFALVEPLIDDPRVGVEHRGRAARMMVELLLANGLEGLELGQVELAARALSLLVEGDARDLYPDEHKAWLLALAEAREILGESGDEVARPLEAALVHTDDDDESLALRRRLRLIYEELGDWSRAERHASVIAEADDDPRQWVGLSELRVWLDDREGAERALTSAIEGTSSAPEAHEALVRLAEQAGETQKVIERLEAWAAADGSGERRARAERLLKAAWLAMSSDPEHSSMLAERAVELIPVRHEALEPIAGEALDVLAATDRHEAMVAVLTRVVSELVSGPSASRLRIRLADLLVQLSREDEARTVIEQGVHRETSADEPLVQRLVEDARAESGERSARRLLAMSDRLGAGAAARRLRVVGAEIAERSGDDQTARTAWSTLLSEVGLSGDESREARVALVRVNRRLEDWHGLLEALLEAAEDASKGDDRAQLLVEAAEIARDRLGDGAWAEALLKRAMVEAPQDRRTGDLLLDVLETHGRWMELDTALAERAETLSNDALADVLSQRAEIARTEIRDEARAAELLTEAFEASPTHPRARRAAEALLRGGGFAEAVKLVERAFELLGRDGDRRTVITLDLLRATAHDSAGQVDEAARVLASLAEYEPQSALVRARRFEVLSRYGRWAELAGALEASAGTVDLVTGLRYRLAAARLFLERVGDRAEAERALTDAVRMVEGWLGAPDVVIPEQLGWGPEDLEQIAPTHGSPLRHLAAMALELGNHPLRVDAYRLYAQSLPAGLAQWRALLSLASAEREAGDLDGAEFTLRGVVEAARSVSPRDRVEAERSLGALLLDRDNPKDAAEALRQAVALLDDSAEGEQAVRAQVLVQLAAAYRAMGDPKRALDALTEARTLATDVIAASDYEQAIEAAGPSEALAQLLERRAEAVTSPTDRARELREAARMWEAIGRRTRAFEPLLEAYSEDPANAEEAFRLQELLYRAERWGDLERHLARRVEVEDLRIDERVRLITERARVLATHLGRTRDALAVLEEARALQPTSIQLLEEIAERAHAVRDDALEQEALARLATLVTSSPAKRRALTERATILERGGELAGAGRCLEEALPLVEPARMRAIADRLARLQLGRGQADAAVRVWIHCSSRANGEEKAAYLARAAQIRLDQMGDSRGAIAAYEAAARAAPADLGTRRAVIELAKKVGDPGKAREHARAAVALAEDLGERDARILYLLEEARTSGALGDVEAELDAYARAFTARPASSSLLDELVARARATLPAERIAAMIEARIEEMDPGLVRGRHRLALARILSEPLGRHWEAQGQREEAEKVDFADLEDAPLLDPDKANGEAPVDENYRALRALLDRSGRWTELAELEERRAKSLKDPVEQAASLVQVGKLFAEHLPEDWPARRDEPHVQANLRRIRDVLVSALTANPEDVEALSRLARIEYLSRAWDRAAPVFRRLEKLGGPSWSAPDFEVAAARVALENDDVNLAVARALRARARDPGSLDALRVLAAACDRVEDAEGREVWIEDLVERLDPVVDAAEIGSLLLRRAEIARLRGHSDRARGAIERALQLTPDEPKARRLHQELMRAAGASRALVDFLERESSRSDVEDPRGSLLAALEVAKQSREQRRSLRIARRLERFISDETVRRRLIAFYAAMGDGEALLRIAVELGSVAGLGELSDGARIRLAAACFAVSRDDDAFDLLVTFLPEGDLTALERADLSLFDRAASEAVHRSAERWDRDSGDPMTVRSPRIVYRLRSIVGRLRSPRAISESGVRWLEGLYAASGGHDLFARPLADAYRAQRIHLEAAARIYRRLLAQNPTDLDLVSSLFRALGGEGANGKAVGARSVLALLGEGDETATFTPLTHRPAEKTVRTRLFHELTATWLGRLLRTTALPMAARLPGANVLPSSWVDASDDRRLADLVRLVREVSGVPFEVWLDLDGGERVSIAAGDPPRIVVGEALADDATPSELRFHVARAAMLIELGYLLAEGAGGPERQRYLDLLVKVASPESAVIVSPELVDQVDAIRGWLSVEDREALAALAIPVSQSTVEVDLEPWMKSAVAAADRFGLLVAGELWAALRGLRRTEPRTLGEPFGSSQERIASVKRWRSASDLIAFVLSADFAEVAHDDGQTSDLRF